MTHLPSLPAMQTAPPKRSDGKAPDGVREAAPRSAAQHERGRGSSTPHKEEKAGPYCTPLLYSTSIQFNFSWFSCISNSKMRDGTPPKGGREKAAPLRGSSPQSLCRWLICPCWSSPRTSSVVSHVAGHVGHSGAFLGSRLFSARTCLGMPSFGLGRFGPNRHLLAREPSSRNVDIENHVRFCVCSETCYLKNSISFCFLISVHVCPFGSDVIRFNSNVFNGHQSSHKIPR